MAATVNANDEQEMIVDPARIGFLLGRIRDVQARLELTFPGMDGSFTSSLIEVDTARRVIIIDELIPVSGNNRIATSRRVHMRASVEGTQYEYQARVVGTGVIDGYTCHELVFPEMLAMKQRRRAFRASVGLFRHVEVSFRLNRYRKVSCLLKNISSGGMLVECRGRLPERIGTGTEISDWVIQLSPVITVIADVSICFVRTVQDGNATLAGVRFIRLSPSGQYQIDQFVAELNRDLVKKMLLHRMTREQQAPGN